MIGSIEFFDEKKGRGMIKINEFLERLLDKQNGSIINKDDEGFVSAFLTVNKPIRLDYQIGSFLDEKKYIYEEDEKEVFKKKMEKYDGISSTFEFECLGEVQIIDEKFNCEIKINGLGMIEYIKEGRKGRIGDGWYENEYFLFRLYLPPNSVKDMIDKIIIYDKVFVDENSDDFMGHLLTPMFGDKIDGGPDKIKIRLDIKVDGEIKTWGSGNKISYEIKRLYL